MNSKFCTLGLFAVVFSLLFAPAAALAADTGLATTEDTQTESTYYILSDQDRYTLIHEVRLINSGLDTAFDVNLSIALMDKETPLYTNRLREQLLPWPDSIRTDEYGRRVAYYHFDELPAGSELVFTQKYVLECGVISYPQLSTAAQAGYEEQLAAQYLLPSPGIESDHAEIIAFAQQAAGRARDAYTMAKDAFAAVNRHMTYSAENLSENPADRGALLALRRAEGVCEDYSKLYVAMLRSLGIAARQQSGYLYLPDEHNVPPYVDKEGRIDLSQMRHAWVEFFLPGQGWVMADPTFTYTYEINGQPVKFIKWDYFAAITKERRYVFFREESLNEADMVNLWVGSGSYVALTPINAYLLYGSQAAYYNDLDGHWAAQSIMNLSERDEPLLQGMGNGLFGVNEPMTRAQLVTCLQRIMKSPAAGPRFTDLKSSHWAYRDIGAAQQAGWINGYPDGTFRPERAVSRAELAQLLVDVFQLQRPEAEILAEEPPLAEGMDEEPPLVEGLDEEPPLAEGMDEEPPLAEGLEQTDAAAEEAQVENATQVAQPVFFDLGQPGYAWADQAITTLAALGYTYGNGRGYYQPERPVTRAEFATFLDRILSAMGK